MVPSTYLDLTCHVIFSTNHRQPWIDERWLPDLHAYIGGTIRGLGATPLAIGGVDDHVHLLMGLRGTHAVSDVVREVKKASTAWVKSSIHLPRFSWQEGYAAFSVSAINKNSVVAYIGNQKEHHRSVSSLEELIVELERAEIVFDDSYLE